MNSTKLKPAPEGVQSKLASLLPLGAWRDLVEAVRAYRPDVVVLVARKMPRITECLDLDFGNDVLVVSDLAIPYIYRVLPGRRVALIDDIVNCGTTLRNALDSLQGCGVTELRVFALGSRGRDENMALDAWFATVQTLDRQTFSTWSRGIPRALQLVPKPYDLEFPVLTCGLATPLRSGAQLLAALSERWPSATVENLTDKDNAKSHGLHRFTVCYDATARFLGKFRVYVDERNKICNIVPFLLPLAGIERGTSILSKFSERLGPELEDLLQGVPEYCERPWPGAARFRLDLYLASLAFGASVVANAGLFVTKGAESGPRTRDMEMLFGGEVASTIGKAAGSLPAIHAMLGSDLESMLPDVWGSVREAAPQCIVACHNNGSSRLGKSELMNLLQDPVCPESLPALPSPFLTWYLRPWKSDFLREVRQKAKSPSLYDLFDAFFATLGSWVGADSPDDFRLGSKDDQDRIKECPYRRLRIGPTFADLVQLLNECHRDMLPSLPVFSYHQVSAMLDRAIDEGFAVPTTASYRGQFFRVYRKGEAPPQRKALARVAYAWDNYGKRMTLTRHAKITAILAYSSAAPSVATPLAVQRGVVGAPNLPEDSPFTSPGISIAEYMRNTGMLL